MQTVADEIERIVMTHPFLEEGLSRGLINCSALARAIQPQVEQALFKDVSESAILMALKRLSAKMSGRGIRFETVLKEMGDLTVRSNLAEFTYLRSLTIMEKQKILLNRIADPSQAFLTFTQGVFETTLIVSAGLADLVEEVFFEEKPLSRLDDLSAIVIKLPAASVSTPGVHYAILKQLAWKNINVVEVVSTYTELTVVLDKDQVDLAFSVLMKFLSS
jgi:hypothetical protein